VFPATGLEPWSSVEIDGVTVTAVPALHGPPGSESVTSDLAAMAAEILGARAVVPLHFEGWTHFTQGQTLCARPSPATGSPTGRRSPSGEDPSPCEARGR